LWAFTSNGLSCPPAEFLEESFLHAASDALVEGGILAINVVSRAAAPHVTSVEVLRKVCQFSNILFVLNCYTRLMRKILIPVWECSLQHNSISVLCTFAIELHSWLDEPHFPWE
jgi:hypothetical protein